MDLRHALLRIATGRPHILVVGAVGTDRLRARVEQELARRCWPIAIAPADANVLVVVGLPGTELESVIDDVWLGVPAPRARVRIMRDEDVVGALDGAIAVLGDLAGQRSRAPRDGAAAGHSGAARAGREDEAGSHAGHGGDAGSDPAEDDTGHGEHGDHGGGHHHHGGGMELPGGLAMADLGDDRDGLALDRLHVALGPVLPEWPSGLVVDVTLQGDVIQEADSRFLDADDHEADDVPDAARALTSTARVLALAGWAGPAARARDLRDAVLFGEDEDPAQVLGDLDALRRRVHRSRLLRWMLRSSGVGESEVMASLDDKLLSARAAISGSVAEPTAVVDLRALDARLAGAEFAAARLIIASADPRPRPALTTPADREGAS
ncbi:hypothetical protein ACQPX6_08480 [Actinomycetospora sp. CA-101289]|uniref:hypothetical protein n=1 Tax=Actinomycetospora sp. CA-101289 TaxID=3239893 RepID=UPI003D951A1C